MSLQEVREQNIALVTQTALACFVENGIDKTTIRDIAHRAGLTERSVYRYFATKDELVVAAAFLYWDRAKAQAAQALVSARQPGMTGIEEIRVLLRSYAYSEGKVWKSRDITHKQVSDWAARVAAKLELTADSVVCLDLPLVGVALVREA